MPIRMTEQRRQAGESIDQLDSLGAASLLLAGQVAAVQAVGTALPALAQGASMLAQGIRKGGNIVYCAAGSSGLMALADGLELPGTYGLENGRIKVLIAGGEASLKHLRGGPEDDENLAALDIAGAELSENDSVIVLSASGSTPYALKATALAKEAGASTIAVANNAGAPLLEMADLAILLPTPPELIAGSTRMGAGTAQKAALNMMSTLMAAELGHVHDGFMVNLVADNEKLKARAIGIVSAVSGCGERAALGALEQAGGAVKPAILLASGAKDLGAASIILESHGGKLRPALSAMKRSQGSKLKRA